MDPTPGAPARAVEPRGSAQVDLDHTDLAVVRELQTDGRLTYETLAQRVGLSRPATRARVQRLLAGGGVRVVAVVHPVVRELTASAHLSIGVSGPAEPVARAIAAMPQAPFVTLTAGSRAVMAELRTKGLAELDRAVESIRSLKGVDVVDPLISLEHLKDPYLLAGRPEVPELDETDRLILDELERDGRLPFAELAERVGLSPAPPVPARCASSTAASPRCSHWCGRSCWGWVFCAASPYGWTASGMRLPDAWPPGTGSRSSPPAWGARSSSERSARSPSRRCATRWRTCGPVRVCAQWRAGSIWN